MRPSEDLMSAALSEAERMRVAGEDPESLGECFLYLHSRNRSLEEVFKHLEYFLKFGMPAEEHAKLLLLTEQIREQDLYDRGDDEVGFGL